MKFLFISGLSALFLTGCDNFQLLKPQSTKNFQELKLNQSDAIPEVTLKPSQDENKPPANTEVTPIDINSNSATDLDNFTEDVTVKIEDDTQKSNTSEKTTQILDGSQPAQQTTVVKAQPQADKAVPLQSSSQSKQPPVKPEHLMNVVEYMNLSSVLSRFLGEDKKGAATQALLPAKLEKSDVKIQYAGTIKKFSYRVLSKDQIVAEIHDFNIAADRLNLVKSNGFNTLALCSGARCEILFISIFKTNEENKIVENYPSILKLIKDEYVNAAFKTGQQYSEDRNALPDANNFKLVPQLAVGRQLDEHLNAFGSQLVSQIKDKLNENESLAYSDQVIGHKSMKADQFKPLFYRQSGQLIIDAQLEFNSPKKPLVFKGEVKSETPSEIIKTDVGLSMSIFPRVKDQIYLVLMKQDKYSSKIDQVNQAIQILICSVMEEESTIFSACTTIPSAHVFQEKDVIEGSAQKQIKEGS